MRAEKACRRQGKHNVRLYAARTRRGVPRHPLKGVMQKNEKGKVPVKKKTEILTARLTPAEKSAIERKAKQAHMTVTDYIVKCALGKNFLPIQDLEPILSELKAQGRKLEPADKAG